jgi:hypothetical protein
VASRRRVLAAARDGNFDALLSVLDPDVIRRIDAGDIGADVARVLRGAQAVASGALAFHSLGLETRRVLVNRAPGVVTFADGQPVAVVGFTVAGGMIVEIDVLADPARVQRLDLSPLALQQT